MTHLQNLCSRSRKMPAGRTEPPAAACWSVPDSKREGDTRLDFFPSDGILVGRGGLILISMKAWPLLPPYKAMRGVLI